MTCAPCMDDPEKNTTEYSGVQVQVPLFSKRQVFEKVFPHNPLIETQSGCPGDAVGVVIDNALEITPYILDRKTIAGTREVPGYLLTLGDGDGEEDLGEYTNLHDAICAAVAHYAEELASNALSAHCAEEHCAEELANHLEGLPS